MPTVQEMLKLVQKLIMVTLECGTKVPALPTQERLFRIEIRVRYVQPAVTKRLFIRLQGITRINTAEIRCSN